MTTAQAGSTVSIEFTGKLMNGEIFGGASKDDPLEFEIGKSSVLEPIQQAIIGMAPGMTKSITIPSEQAFGPRRKERIIRIPRCEFPSEIHPKKGKTLKLQGTEGGETRAQITSVSETEVVLDQNHPLADEDLIVSITLLAILSPPGEACGSQWP